MVEGNPTTDLEQAMIQNNQSNRASLPTTGTDWLDRMMTRRVREREGQESIARDAQRLRMSTLQQQRQDLSSNEVIDEPDPDDDYYDRLGVDTPSVEDVVVGAMAESLRTEIDSDILEVAQNETTEPRAQITREEVINPVTGHVEMRTRLTPVNTAPVNTNIEWTEHQTINTDAVLEVFRNDMNDLNRRLLESEDTIRMSEARIIELEQQVRILVSNYNSDYNHNLNKGLI